MSEQRLVPVLRTRPGNEDHRREGAAGSGSGEGARQRVATVRVGIADLFRHVGEGFNGILGPPRVGFVRGCPFQHERQGVAHLGERPFDAAAVRRQRALVGAADHRHRHGDRRAGQRDGLDRNLGVALVHRERLGGEPAIALGKLESQAQLKRASVERAHPVPGEVGGCGGPVAGLLARSFRAHPQRCDGDGHADQQGSHGRLLSTVQDPARSEQSYGKPATFIHALAGPSRPFRRRPDARDCAG